MVFSSVIFLFFFLPIVLFGYYLLKNITLKNAFLLVASLLFYAWGEGELVLLVVVSALINYAFGYWVATKEKKKLFLTIGVILNLGLLIYYKYIGFIIENLDQFSFIHIDKVHIALPIGISFFTFHGLSYLVDIYRGKATVQKSYFNLLLYITFFPQLVAGPIIRYHDVADQLLNRETTIDKTVEGIRRFIIGLAKKVLIANQIGALADQIFSTDYSAFGCNVAWLGIIAYTLQIFYDFSGYSDMAIGLAKMFGFEFLENFNYPYISRSVREFWTRWHISLSNWFRDYLYIPLGGSRNGNGATYRNLLIVFFCTGLWHGASWNFIIWGFYHGFFMIMERLFLSKHLERHKILSHLYAIPVLIISWVFFRIENFNDGLKYLGKLFSFFPGKEFKLSVGTFMNSEYWLALIIAIIFCVPWHRVIVINKLSSKSFLNYAQMAGLLVLFLLSIMSVITDTYNPFIYFRF
ncbi:MAG TPA: MBOAT family O-acyltransferase [Bacteroidia bacterium]|nr:MBOAT family O-acyltransferase [Bacteroidia bacterium]